MNVTTITPTVMQRELDDMARDNVEHAESMLSTDSATAGIISRRSLLFNQACVLACFFIVVYPHKKDAPSIGFQI